MKLFPLLTPAGSDTQIQYNKNNLFGGDIALTWDDGAAKALTIGNCAVLGSDSAVFQPNADSTTFFQILDADGGTPIFNVDSTNERVGLGGVSAPTQTLDLTGSIELENTTTNTTGVIFKNSKRFIHNFQHPTGGGAVPIGRNFFMGEDAGNFTMGSTATEIYHASENLGAGRTVLSNNTLGYSNTGLGSSALLSNTTGFQNFAGGQQSLLSNTTGFRNSGVGAFSLYGITTTSNNTGIGYGSGRYIANGSTVNATPVQSTYIGSAARASALAQTNELVIGYTAIGKGSNTSVFGNSSVTDSFFFGNVTLTNPTHEDTDGGGEVKIIGKREDGAGTETAAGQIEISHDGVVANDQLGKMILSVNTGAGLVQVLEIGSDLLATFAGEIESPKSKRTTIGGYAIKLTNKTGGNSVAGYCVTNDDSTADAVKLVPINVPNCIGVFLDSGIADGSEAWVVVGGIADVYFWGSTTLGHLARTGLTADTGEVAGQALSEAVPTSPFSVDKHFCEIGHVLESRVGAGLARCNLHFN